MLRNVDCQIYRQWKKEQEAKLKGPKRKIKVKRRKRKETPDCLEEEKKEKPKTILKIRYRKCSEKDTKKAKQGPIFKPKTVCSTELVIRRIQPPLEVRHQLLARHHAECFTESVPEVDVTVLRETRVQIPKIRKRKKSRRKKKAKADQTISEEEKVNEGEQEETVNEDEQAEEEGEETAEENENVEEEDAAEEAVDENDDKTEVKRKRKDKFWCKKLKRKIDSESEDSECDSICSFDSDICLKGLALTIEDKKKIQENRRNVRASSTT